MNASKYLSAAIIVGVAGSWLYLMSSPGNRLPVTAADGDYGNRCCGIISLRHGTMTFKSGAVNYVIGKDKQGAYVLPTKFVGPSPPDGLLIDSQKYPLKLRVADDVHPATISLIGYDNRQYDFAR